MIQIDDKELAKRGLAPKVRNIWSLVDPDIGASVY